MNLKVRIHEDGKWYATDHKGRRVDGHESLESCVLAWLESHGEKAEQDALKDEYRNGHGQVVDLKEELPAPVDYDQGEKELRDMGEQRNL